MSLTVYGYSKCGTCRKAQKWLEQNNIEYEWVDIITNPPAAGQLGLMVQQSGQGIRKFLNTSGEVYRSMSLKDKLPAMTEDEMLLLLEQNGKLIKRPLATDGEKTTVGFVEEEFQKTWI